MKVRELIDVLGRCDLDSEVIIQKDINGKDFSPCYGVYDDVIYEEYNDWSGYIKEKSNEENEENEENNSYVVVIHPIN